MTTASPLELALYRLPLPVVVRELDYEASLASRTAQFKALWEAKRAADPDLPAFDTLVLESDPAKALLEVAAFGDMLFVGELNDTARVVRVVSFAQGSDLELHAAEVDLTRRTDEKDPELRSRVVTRRRGSSAAGPDDWYLWHAQAASKDVAEVNVDDGGGWVDVAVRSKVGDGVPDAALLAALRAVLTSRAVRPRCIRVTVSPAVPKLVNVRAELTLDPDAIDPVFEAARDGFAAAFDAHVRLGRDITRTWLTSQLSPLGVKSVNLIEPAADLVIAPNEIAKRGVTLITQAGRDW
ncbi:baseplate J/gp47 family protein [Tardiphaga sp. 709]|uniref:baseplate J/gp47 family protein n=1 Tax=Tardiphaga sp. 709 TaxID=3076039 RepID=UPI0028E66966|nr:baseplate J/gp47 family protein [Tardiphaga sp. 709]WNV10096.1 baseplate J/gp47 family protein [Tardiphaga sp. 709]